MRVVDRERERRERVSERSREKRGRGESECLKGQNSDLPGSYFERRETTKIFPMIFLLAQNENLQVLLKV